MVEVRQSESQEEITPVNSGGKLRRAYNAIGAAGGLAGLYSENLNRLVERVNGPGTNRLRRIGAAAAACALGTGGLLVASKLGAELGAEAISDSPLAQTESVDLGDNAKLMSASAPLNVEPTGTINEATKIHDYEGPLSAFTRVFDDKDTSHAEAHRQAHEAVFGDSQAAKDLRHALIHETDDAYGVKHTDAPNHKIPGMAHTGRFSDDGLEALREFDKQWQIDQDPDVGVVAQDKPKVDTADTNAAQPTNASDNPTQNLLPEKNSGGDHGFDVPSAPDLPEVDPVVAVALTAALVTPLEVRKAMLAREEEKRQREAFSDEVELREIERVKALKAEAQDCRTELARKEQWEKNGAGEAQRIIAAMCAELTAKFCYYAELSGLAPDYFLQYAQSADFESFMLEMHSEMTERELLFMPRGVRQRQLANLLVRGISFIGGAVQTTEDGLMRRDRNGFFMIDEDKQELFARTMRDLVRRQLAATV